MEIPTETRMEAFERILSRLFMTEVSDMRPCRLCKCPVLHMEHLSLDEAQALETEVRAMLGIPATFEESEGV